MAPATQVRTRDRAAGDRGAVLPASHNRRPDRWRCQITVGLLRRGRFILLTAALVVSGAALTAPAQAAPDPGAQWIQSPEVSETTRLADRRSLVSGDRMYAMGDTSGLYPAAGWHIR